MLFGFASSSRLRSTAGSVSGRREERVAASPAQLHWPALGSAGSKHQQRSP